MQATLKPFVLGAIVALAVAAALVRPAGALASSPCWKALLNDWYDGRIDHTYAIHCYREALSHLPADAKTYSSAQSDIERALQSAIAAARKQGKTPGPNTLVKPPTSTTTTSTTATTSTGVTETTEGSGADTVPAPEPGRQPEKGLQGVADQLNPSSSTSLPLPLLVLGGLALVLLAAGAVGLVLKHVQNRRRPL